MAGRTRLLRHSRTRGGPTRLRRRQHFWNYATSGGWTVITRDEDFVERCLGNPVAPAVVWLRIGNCTNCALFSWLEPLLPEITRQLESGQRLVEVRREKPPSQ